MSPLNDELIINGLIIFRVFVPGTFLDLLGNVCANTEELPVKVYLKTEALSTATQVEKHPGVDQSIQTLSGYCVDPQILPAGVSISSWYPCRFGQSHGSFFLKPFDRFGRAGIDRLIEAELGTTIKGTFQIGRISK